MEKHACTYMHNQYLHPRARTCATNICIRMHYLSINLHLHKQSLTHSIFVCVVIARSHVLQRSLQEVGRLCYKCNKHPGDQKFLRSDNNRFQRRRDQPQYARIAEVYSYPSFIHLPSWSYVAVLCVRIKCCCERWVHFLLLVML